MTRRAPRRRRPRREPGGPDSINDRRETVERGGGLLPLRRADRPGDAWRREGPDLAGERPLVETIAPCLCGRVHESLRGDGVPVDL